MAAPLAVPALADRGGAGGSVRLVNLVTGPRQIAIAYQPRGVALDTGDLKDELRRLRDEAERIGFMTALPEIEAALEAS